MEPSLLQEFILRYHYALKSPALAGQSVMAYVHMMPFHGPFFPKVTREISQLAGLPFPLPEPVYAKGKRWYLKSREVQVIKEKKDKKGRGTYTMTVTETTPLKGSYELLVPGEDEWLEGEDAHDKINAMPPEERANWTWMNDIPPTKEQEEEAYQAWKRMVLEPGLNLPEPLAPIPEHG